MPRDVVLTFGFCHHFACNQMAMTDDPNESRVARMFCESHAYYHRECVNCHLVIHRNAVYRGPDREVLCGECYDNLSVNCVDCDARFIPQNGATICGPCNEHRERTNVHSDTFEELTHRRAIGVELEFVHDREDSRPTLSRWGELKEDGSVHDHDDDEDDPRYAGREFASFPHAGDAAYRMIEAVCSRIKQCGGFVNDTCGFHLHFEAGDLSNDERMRVRRWWQTFEKIFMQHTDSDRWDNGYCKPVRHISDAEWADDRYFAFNIQAYQRHRTYEIRLHHGTLEAEVIKAWVKLILDFVETFRHIPCSTGERNELIERGDRAILIFFFQQMKMPLKLRKQIVKRNKYAPTWSNVKMNTLKRIAA